MVIAAVALAARLLLLWQIADAPVAGILVGDGRAYETWAGEIAAGDWLGRETFYQAPLYPYFLATVHVIAGPGLDAVRLAQALLGAAACVLLYFIGRDVFGPAVGWVAGLALALWPSALFHDAIVQKSSLDVFLLCALLASVTVALQRRRTSAWLVAGVALAALVLTRENALVFAPVLLAAIAVTRDAPRLRWAGALCLGMATLLVPVALRNFAVGGELHLTTAQFGPNFFIGNGPGASGMYRPLVYGRGDAQYERADATRLAETALGRKLSSGEVSAYWTERAVESIREQPQRWLSLLARKSLLLVNRVEVGDTEDQYTYADWSPFLALLGFALHFGIAVPLAAAGVVMTWRSSREVSVLLALAVAYGASVVATYVMARYRHPLLPILLLFAAAAVVDGVRRAREKRWRSLILPAVVALMTAVLCNLPLVSEAKVRSGSLYNIARALEGDPRSTGLALAYYRRAVALDPSYALAQNNLAVALTREGRRDEALAHMRLSLELEPANAEFHYNLAGLQLQIGDQAHAADSYRRALELDPAHVDARKNLAALRQSQGRLDEAERELSAALTLEPNNPGLLNNLGVIDVQRGKLDAAIERFRTATRVAPLHDSAQENLARALADAGRPQEAVAAFESLAALRASRHAPADARDALERALKLAEGSGDTAATARLARRLAESSP